MARPNKFTPVVLEKLYNGIRLGLAYQHACTYAGIDYGTFNRWRNGQFPRGVKAKQKEQFFNDLMQAEGDAQARLMTVINKAASDTDWKAAAWILERRYPEHYGRHDVMLTHRGDPDAPIQTETTMKVEAAHVEELLDGLTEEELDVLTKLNERLLGSVG